MALPRPKFCIRCGSPLRKRAAFGRKRYACTACDYVHFDDPKVAVGVVAERRGKILLVKRNHEPKIGEWSFPSGYIDRGEVLEDGALREAKEETGLDLRLTRLLGAWSAPGDRVVFIAFAARSPSGKIVVGPECMDARFFALHELPPLAFPHDGAILKAWQENRR